MRHDTTSLTDKVTRTLTACSIAYGVASVSGSLWRHRPLLDAMQDKQTVEMILGLTAGFLIYDLAEPTYDLVKDYFQKLPPDNVDD